MHCECVGCGESKTLHQIGPVSNVPSQYVQDRATLKESTLSCGLTSIENLTGSMKQLHKEIAHSRDSFTRTGTGISSVNASGS